MRITVIFVMLTALLVPVKSFAAVPVYSAEYAGPGLYASLNGAGVVIGNNSTGPGQPWVNNGSGPQDLPLPPGVLAARVSDINDNDQIVGTVYPDGQIISDLPVIWTPDGAGGYDVEMLPLAGSATRATGVAINNLGQILVSGFQIDGVLPTYRAYVIDGADVVPLPQLSNPITINDNGIILTNLTLFDYSNMTDLGMPPPPDGISPIGMYPSDLNNYNEMAVTMLTAVISYTHYQALGIYTIGGDWNMLTGVVTNMSTGGMNDIGDVLVNAGSCATMVYLAELGFYCPDSLLDPTDTDWTLGRALDVADDGSLLAYGNNAATGDAGAVLMTEIGILPFPAAPIDVAAIPHVPTSQQNFVSIDVSWAPADGLTRSYIVERQGPGDAGFVQLTSTTNQFYRDMSLVSGETYSYRILAVGLAGNSVPSTVVSAIAPARGDSEAPVITSVSLQNGDIVSGAINIDVTATDNVGVSLIRVNATGMNQPCDTYNSTTASCRWDTTGLTAGTYSVHVSASDAMGNGVLEIITVTVSAASLRTDITMSSSSKRGVTSVKAVVLVTNAQGGVERSAIVNGKWTLPDGSFTSHSESSDRKGKATFSTPANMDGIYLFEILTVTKSGFAWDELVSETSDSFTLGDGGGNQPPIASFTDNCTALACSFNGSGSSDPDGTITSYSWNFGDGASSTGANASHTYTAAGNYSVTLVVTDNSGATGNSTRTISVSGEPTPTQEIHVGDIDGSSVPAAKNRWMASATVLIHDDAEASAGAGVTITGSWSNGANGSGDCVTNASGICTISKGNLKSNVSSVTFTVTSVTAANHDPDGDSNGTVIVITK